MAKWIFKKEKAKYTLSPRESPLKISSREKHGLKEEGWKMILQANCCQKKLGVAILI